jgi:mannose-6-phosphate isomerase-like protein (cupin superfamily)
MSYHANITSKTQENKDFRHVLFTGTRSQLVAMEIPVGEEVGEETHEHVEQILFIQSGEGEGHLNNEVLRIGPGDAVVVTPGTRHNFKNTGDEPLKIFTVYSPPNHIDGRVHRTKIEADADEEDEAFGHAQQ